MSPATASVFASPARPALRGRTSLPRLFLVPPARDEEPTTQPAAEPGPERDLSHDATALYRQHGAIIYRRCLRLLRDPEAARDATQEVFLKLIRDEERLFDREDVAPWLYRVATNHCLNLKRDARHHGEVTLEDGPEPSCPGCDGLDAVVVRRLLARFDAVTQLIAVAILVDEQDHEEVAAALGLSRRTMARKLDRFMELARRHLVLSGEAPDRR